MYFPILWKKSSHMKKNDLLLPIIYKAIKLFWLLDWDSIERVLKAVPEGNRRLWGKNQLPSSWGSSAWAGRTGKHRHKVFWSLQQSLQTTIDLLEENVFQHATKIAWWPAGAQTWTQTWTLQPDQQVLKFCSLQNHSINCVEFQFF